MPKRKNERPLKARKWNRQFKFYHNKASNHFLLGVAKRGNTIAGHDMTTHPSLTKDGKPRKKYLLLNQNPNRLDERLSYIDKKFRNDVQLRFADTLQRRLTIKKKWKLDKASKKVIKKLDRKKIKIRTTPSRH